MRTVKRSHDPARQKGVLSMHPILNQPRFGEALVLSALVFIVLILCGLGSPAHAAARNADAGICLGTARGH